MAPASLAQSILTENSVLSATDGAIGENYGIGVDISGNFAIVGAPRDDDMGQDAGSVYIYELITGNWILSQKLVPPDILSGDLFGWSVAIEDDFAAVGAPFQQGRTGVIYVFRRAGSNWIQEAKLKGTDTVGGDDFGFSVDISGLSVVAGAFHHDHGIFDSGSLYVFTFNGSGWNQEAELRAGDPQVIDNLGYDVAIDGDRVVTGAHFKVDGGGNKGAVYVFQRSGSVWSQGAKILPSDPLDRAFFGIFVAVSGDVIVVGQARDSTDPTPQETTYIFRKTGTTWGEETQILPDNGNSRADRFAASVAVEGDLALIGLGAVDLNGQNTGQAYFYRWDGAAWNQEAILNTVAPLGDLSTLGYSVALSGSTAIVSAPWADGTRGQAFIFQSNFVMDSDGDGVADIDDICPVTVSDQVRHSKRNRWAYLGGDSFVQFKRGRRHSRKSLSFSIAETAGCSCAQIVDQLGGHKKHARRGCSTGLLRHWVRVIGAGAGKSNLVARGAEEHGILQDSESVTGVLSLTDAEFNFLDEVDDATSADAGNDEAGGQADKNMDEGFALEGNYPNPFNPETVIRFRLVKGGVATLKVFDILGRKVADLVSGQMTAGVHEFRFDGSAFPSGMYMYRLTTSLGTEARTMLLQK